MASNGPHLLIFTPLCNHLPQGIRLIDPYGKTSETRKCTLTTHPAEEMDEDDTEFKQYLWCGPQDGFLPLTVMVKNVSSFDNCSNVTASSLGSSVTDKSHFLT